MGGASELSLWKFRTTIGHTRIMNIWVLVMRGEKAPSCERSQQSKVKER